MVATKKENEPTVKWNPQPLEVLRERFHLAVGVDHTHEADAPPEPRPGGDADHVFDFDRGLRLIISFDVTEHPIEEGRRAYLHVSASVRPTTLLAAHIARCGSKWAAIKLLLDLAQDRAARLTGIEGLQRHLIFLGLSKGKSVPHFLGPTPEAFHAMLKE